MLLCTVLSLRLFGFVISANTRTCAPLNEFGVAPPRGARGAMPGRSAGAWGPVRGNPSIAFQLHQKPAGSVCKVRFAHVANREQVEMSPRTGEMEARRQGAPVLILMCACAARHYSRDHWQGVGGVVKNAHRRQRSSAHHRLRGEV